MDLAALRRELIRDEGLRTRAYKDTVGKLTAGIGRNLEDVEFTQDEIDLMFHNDIQRCVDDLQGFSWWAELDPVRQRAICNMRFNLGPNKFREFKATLEALDRKDYYMASQRMLASKWAAQVKSRAIRLARMVRDGAERT
jgi:lysozyme